MEKPRYIYEDGNVIDRENRQRVIGEIISDIESGKHIATSFVSFIYTCGYSDCRRHGEYDQKSFDDWDDADAWLIGLNEAEGGV